MRVSLQHCPLQINFTFAKHTLTQLLFKMYCLCYIYTQMNFKSLSSRKTDYFFSQTELNSGFSKLRAFFFFFFQISNYFFQQNCQPELIKNHLPPIRPSTSLLYISALFFIGCRALDIVNCQEIKKFIIILQRCQIS